jgi:hypothetical protein
VAEEPVKVKLYGLVSRTRRGYLTYSVFEVLGLVAFVSVWFLRWPIYRKVLLPLDKQPAFGRVYIPIMDAVPWIVLCLIVYKLIELWVVLRRFALKEEEQRRRTAAGAAPRVNAGSG